MSFPGLLLAVPNPSTLFRPAAGRSKVRVHHLSLLSEARWKVLKHVESFDVSPGTECFSAVHSSSWLVLPLCPRL